MSDDGWLQQHPSDGWTPCPIDDAEGLVDLMEGQVERGKDLMAACHGGEGSGKSTTAKNLGRAMERRLGVKVVVIFNLWQLLKVMLGFQKGQVYILDEAINIFHNQDWATWKAKLLTKIIRQMRIMRCIWILCVPDFEGLHPYLRTVRIPVRLYHKPIWTRTGMANGPASILWKQERLNYQTGEVEYRWQDVGDFHAYCLDDDPEWQEYELDKVENFKGLVRDFRDRLKDEEAKENKRKKKASK